jgi:hypothetical protein
VLVHLIDSIGDISRQGSLASRDTSRLRSSVLRMGAQRGKLWRFYAMHVTILACAKRFFCGSETPFARAAEFFSAVAIFGLVLATTAFHQRVAHHYFNGIKDDARKLSMIMTADRS